MGAFLRNNASPATETAGAFYRDGAEPAKLVNAWLQGVLVWPEKGEYIFTIDGYDVKTYNVGPLGNITFDSNIISRRGSREISWIWNF